MFKYPKTIDFSLMFWKSSNFRKRLAALLQYVPLSPLLLIRIYVHVRTCVYVYNVSLSTLQYIHHHFKSLPCCCFIRPLLGFVFSSRRRSLVPVQQKWFYPRSCTFYVLCRRLTRIDDVIVLLFLSYFLQPVFVGSSKITRAVTRELLILCLILPQYSLMRMNRLSSVCLVIFYLCLSNESDTIFCPLIGACYFHWEKADWLDLNH